MAEEKTLERARDELFSHINRCGVLQAAEEDQRQWMDETVDYLGERFPDLGEVHLRDLHTVGLRFCRPAIRYGAPATEAEVVETSKPASVKPADAPSTGTDAPEAATEAPSADVTDAAEAVDATSAPTDESEVVEVGAGVTEEV